MSAASVEAPDPSLPFEGRDPLERFRKAVLDLKAWAVAEDILRAPKYGFAITPGSPVLVFRGPMGVGQHGILLPRYEPGVITIDSLPYLDPTSVRIVNSIGGFLCVSTVNLVHEPRLFTSEELADLHIAVTAALRSTRFHEWWTKLMKPGFVARVLGFHYAPSMKEVRSLCWLCEDGTISRNRNAAKLYASEAEAWEHLKMAEHIGKDEDGDWCWVEAVGRQS